MILKIFGHCSPTYLLVGFPHGLSTSFDLKKGYKIYWKRISFQRPFWIYFYALGGYPVNRSERTNMVDSMINIFNIHDKFAVAMSPEGTRKRSINSKQGSTL